MGAELGATTSIFPFDEHMAKYLRATERVICSRMKLKNLLNILTADPEIEADPEKYFDQVIEIDLDYA